jgi:hypothetical protein
MNPQPPAWPPGQPPTPPPAKPSRPADVDTGFWLWLAAVPLMVIGQFADGYVVSRATDSPNVLVTTALLATIIGAVVLTFIVLMRSGYRWARTLLTAGGVATILYTAASLFGTQRPALPAVIYAVTGIIGVVLIGGGIFLLHRQDSNKFFDS